jgi:integrase
MRHAVHQELIEHNPAANLDGIIAPPVKRHYPALPLERPELLTRIEDYQQGRELTRLAVSLTLHLFIRSSELRFARWSEIDFKNKIWTIPATREAIPGVRYSGRGRKCAPTYRSTLPSVHRYSETDTGNIRASGGIPRRS